MSLDVVSELFEGKKTYNPVTGVRVVERVTSGAVRIESVDKVDYDILEMVAAEEGYLTKSGSFTPRVVDKGVIIARVGSRSDPGRRHDLFIYLFPPDEKQMTTYARTVALQKGVYEPETKRINLGSEGALYA